jgi:hypothetical protein
MVRRVLLSTVGERFSGAAWYPAGRSPTAAGRRLPIGAQRTTLPHKLYELFAVFGQTTPWSFFVTLPMPLYMKRCTRWPWYVSVV